MSVLMIALSACGGSSSSIIGRWSDERVHFEFFSDGTVIITSIAGRWNRTTDWRVDGNRIAITRVHTVVSFPWEPFGSWYFDVSRNTLTLERAPGGTTRTLYRIE